MKPTVELVSANAIVRIRDRAHAEQLIARIPTSRANEGRRLVEDLLAGRVVAVERREPRPLDRTEAWSAPLLSMLTGGQS